MTSFPKFDNIDNCLSNDFSISVLGAALPNINRVGLFTNCDFFEISESTSVSETSHVLAVT